MENEKNKVTGNEKDTVTVEGIKTYCYWEWKTIVSGNKNNTVTGNEWLYFLGIKRICSYWEWMTIVFGNKKNMQLLGMNDYSFWE